MNETFLHWYLSFGVLYAAWRMYSNADEAHDKLNGIIAKTPLPYGVIMLVIVVVLTGMICWAVCFWPFYAIRRLYRKAKGIV